MRCRTDRWERWRLFLVVIAFASSRSWAAEETERIQLGPISAEVPASWMTETVDKGTKVRAVAPDSKTIGAISIPVLVTIEQKEKLGSSLRDLQAFLERSLDDDAKKGKELIRKDWEKFNGRIGVESLRASKPTIRGKKPNEFLVMSVQSDCVVEGEPVALITRSYWVYVKERSYLLRIVVPLELADPYAKAIDQIAHSVRVNGVAGETPGASLGEERTR